MRRKLVLIFLAALLAACCGCGGAGGIYYNDCLYFGDCYYEDYYYPYGYYYPFQFRGEGEEHEEHEGGDLRVSPRGGGEHEERGFRR